MFSVDTKMQSRRFQLNSSDSSGLKSIFEKIRITVDEKA